MVPAEDDWDAPPVKGLSSEPDFRPIRRPVPKKRRGLWVFVGVLLVAGGVGVGGWYFLNDWLVAEPDGEVPMIRADTGPIKVRPDEPGGMDVPDRDKLVYDRIDGNDERKTVERLLPPPETPLPKPAPSAEETPVAPQTSVPSAATPSVPAKPMAPPPPPAPPGKAEMPAAPTPAPQKVVPSVEDVLTAMRPPPPIETKKEATPAQSVAKTGPAKIPSATNGGAFQVQLSALRSHEQAETEWDRLRRRNSDLLENMKLSVVRADLGPGKGVFFRLRAGPLADEQAAQNLCQKLSERKVGCLVVRPEG